MNKKTNLGKQGRENTFHFYFFKHKISIIRWSCIVKKTTGNVGENVGLCKPIIHPNHVHATPTRLINVVFHSVKETWCKTDSHAESHKHLWPFTRILYIIFHDYFSNRPDTMFRYLGGGVFWMDAEKEAIGLGVPQANKPTSSTSRCFIFHEVCM